jgi:eukaryotic-like serine/threonine-protein kinase
MTRASVLLASRYRLEAQIAAGGIGEVWRAQDLVLDRPVAVKMLRSEYAGQPQALARFRAEARQAGSVSHQSIAQVYDYGEVGPAGSPYLVMELVNGPSLAGVLATGPLDAASALDVLAQAAAGLQAAHEAGLVHRDIKPANLVVGPGGQVKITDFGIAYAAGSVQLTRTGMVLGTPAYLAPEQFAGDQASPAGDLYALGVVGYECLAGTRPFRGEPTEVAAAHRDRPLPPLPAAVPAAAAALVSQLTAKDPAARPHDAAEVATRASQLRDSLTGGAPTALAEIAGGPVPYPELAAHPATLVEAPPLTWHDTQPGPVGRPASRARRRPNGRRRRGALVAAAGVALLAGLGAWLLVATMPALPSSQPSPSAQVSHPASSPTVQTVQVNDAALVGQPVSAVSQQLSQLGLTPAITWTASEQDPGTVLSVQPSGSVPAGSTVTVIAAFPEFGHGHGGHHGGGLGDGGDQGD